MEVEIERSLVLQQPWATAVCEGAFPALVRSQSTNIRGWVGVLSTRKFDPLGVVESPDAFPQGAFVGAVKIEECLKVVGNPFKHLGERFGREFVEVYPRHFLLNGAYIWSLSETLIASRPMPFVGAVPMVWARTPLRIAGKAIPIAKTRKP